jgi:hypothetical protein
VVAAAAAAEVQEKSARLATAAVNNAPEAVAVIGGA